MTGLAAAAIAALAAAVVVAWPGLTALRMHAARQMGGAPSWWRCALLLDQPGPLPAGHEDHNEEVDAA